MNIKLYPFQEAILKSLETKDHVNIQTGYGKAMILVEYARRHPEQKILCNISPSLLSQYLLLIKEANVTNITLIT